MKLIYSYKNYRVYLQDLYLNEKKKSSSFTYASFAKKAKLGSPNYLKLVIDGKRNLTTANIQTFAKSMNFSGREIDFFEAMVLENQAKNEMEKRYYARRLNAIRKTIPSKEDLVTRKNPTDTIANILNLAILLLVKGKREEEVVLRAVDELGLTRVKAEALLKDLLNKGELVKNEEGLLFMPARHTMMSDPKRLSEKQRKFLDEGMKEAQTVFSDRYPLGSAKFLSLLLSAPSGSLNEMFDDLRAAIEAIAQKYDPLLDQESGIYRLQLQTYRLGKNEE